MKLGAVIVASVGVTVLVVSLGRGAGMSAVASALLAGALALGLVQILARGMTSPLREMASATRAMARGDYGRRVTATSRDEVGELARAFNAMAVQLAEVDRVRRDLVANVSHELRTPITALRANLENLVDGVEQPDAETLRTMLRQTERLGALVAQLLDLSRLESGAVPLQRRTFAVEAVLEDAASESRMHAPGVDVSVLVESPEPLADGDPARVHQVVANLLDNAVRYSPARRHGGAAGPPGQGHRHHRGPRPRARDQRGGLDPGLRALLPGRRRPARRATAGPASAWPSPAGSSTSTAARSGPSRPNPPAAAWWSSSPPAARDPPPIL